MDADKVPGPNHAEPAAISGIFSYVRDLTTDALRYWELRRLFYNLVLAVIVTGHFIAAWPASRILLTFDSALGLFCWQCSPTSPTRPSTSPTSSFSSPASGRLEAGGGGRCFSSGLLSLRC